MANDSAQVWLLRLRSSEILSPNMMTTTSTRDCSSSSFVLFPSRFCSTKRICENHHRQTSSLLLRTIQSSSSRLSRVFDDSSHICIETEETSSTYSFVRTESFRRLNPRLNRLLNTNNNDEINKGGRLVGRKLFVCVRKILSSIAFEVLVVECY